jgi:acetyl esterase/lipase
MKNLLHRLILKATCCSSFVLIAIASNQATAQAAVTENVEFAEVLQYPSRNYDHRLDYATGEFQYGLLWLPEDHPSPPLLVFIHGGCWLNSFDVNHSFAASSALADAGIAVWSLEYRRTGDPGGGWPGTFEDITNAIASIDELKDFGVDTSRFAIAGHSAGGHLALLAGSRFREASAVIGLAAIADIDAYARGSNSCQTATPSFMNAEPDVAPELYAAANPAQQTLHANTHLLHGDLDTIVPHEQTQKMQARLTTVTGAGHFDWIHPATPAFSLLLELLKRELLR